MTNINESYQPDLVLSDDEIKLFNEDNGELVLDRSFLKGNKVGDYILIRFIGDESDTVQKYRIARESVEDGDFTLDWIESIESGDELDSLLEELEDTSVDNLSPYISSRRGRGKVSPREVDNGRNNMDVSLVDDKTVAAGVTSLPYVDAVNFHRRRRDEVVRKMKDNMKLADELIGENERDSHRVPRTPALKKMKLAETGGVGGVTESISTPERPDKRPGVTRSRRAKKVLGERVISTDITEDKYSVTDEADPFDMLYRKLTSTGELVTGISKKSGKEAKFTERGPYEVDQVMVDVNDNIVVYATTREELDPAIKIAEKYGVTYQIDKPNMFARTYPYSIVLDPWTADLDKLVAATGYRDESYEDDIETEIVEEGLSGDSAYEKILKVISKPGRKNVKEDLEDISVEEVGEKSDLPNFTPEDDVVDVFNKIKELDKLKALDRLLERMFPDGMTEEELNDLLRYDAEWVFKMLGIAED